MAERLVGDPFISRMREVIDNLRKIIQTTPPPVQIPEMFDLEQAELIRLEIEKLKDQDLKTSSQEDSCKR